MLGNSTSTQVSIINGRRTDKTSWTVQLAPRHRGKLQIPAINVGNEQTQPLELEVTDIPEQVKAQQSEHLFLDVETDTHGQALYVQQQLTYTVRLYYDDTVLKGELEAPHPEHAVVEQLGEDKHYADSHNGRRYNVIERHYAISPENSGQLRIPPVTFNGQIQPTQNGANGRSRPDDFMEQFFRSRGFPSGSLFNNSPFASTAQPVHVHSKEIVIDVHPRPATAGKSWLPAEQIILKDSWTDNPPQFRTGEPVTRTITLLAKGLSGTQIPTLQLEQPEQTRLYPESPVNESHTDGDKVYGTSKQSFTYIPNKAGKLTISAVELKWWNTLTDKAAVAQIPKWEVTVEAGVSGTQTPATTATTAAMNTADSTPVANTEKPATNTPSISTNWIAQIKAFNHWWAVAGAILFLLIVGFVLKWLRDAQSASPAVKQTNPTETTTSSSIKNLMRQLEHACSMNDAKTAARGLLELGRNQWPENPPHNLGALATRLEDSREHIMALDRILYAADNSTWDGSILWDSVKNSWHKKPHKEKALTDSLKPLYPQNV